MHGLAYVLIPPVGDVARLVESTMEAHREDDDLDHGWWDWFQVGGRFSGRLDGHDPRSDPRNIETCKLCGGTGRRSDADHLGAEWLAWSGGCNGCKGAGTCLAWPTNWVAHPGDVADVEAVSVDWADSCAVVAGEAAVARSHWANGEWTELDDAEYEAAVAALVASTTPLARVVVVDFHN